MPPKKDKCFTKPKKDGGMYTTCLSGQKKPKSKAKPKAPAKPKAKPKAPAKKKAKPTEDEPKPDISQENWFRINPFNPLANPNVGKPSADSEDIKKGFVRKLWYIESRKRNDDDFKVYSGWWKAKPTKTGVSFVATNIRLGITSSNAAVPQKKRYSISYKKLKTMLRKVEGDRLQYYTDKLRRYEFIGQEAGGELQETFT